MQEQKRLVIDISTASVLRVLAICAILAFLWLIRDVVAIIFFSILLVLLLQPPVAFLSRYKIPKPLTVIGIYGLLVSLFVIIILLVIPPISQQFSQVTELVGRHSQTVANALGFEISVENDLGTLQQAIGNWNTYFSGATADIFSRLTSAIGTIFTIGLVLVVTFYGLVEESALVRVIKSTIPVKFQPYLYHIANRTQKKLGLWLRGQLLLGLIVFVLTYLGLTMLDVEYALVLALMTGLLEFIPYIGPIFSGLIAVLLTIFVNPIRALFVLILYIAIQQIENHILVPKVMQHATGLNPVVSVIALLIGGKLGGIVGLILAIPAALVLSVFAQDLVDNHAEQPYKLEG